MSADTDQKLRKHVLEYIIPPLMTVYFIGTGIAIPYFNWCYARDHGFLSWLCFGEVVASFQALAWPYYAIASTTGPSWAEDERENLQHFYRSKDAEQQAAKILNSHPSDHVEVLSKAESDAFESLLRLAFVEAKQVDLQLLDKAHPHLREHYVNDYLKYLEIKNGFLERDIDPRSKSREEMKQYLQLNADAEAALERWIDWYNANRKQIRLPKK